jgi:transcriptional regulator with XRE-family HTH domain
VEKGATQVLRLKLRTLRRQRKLSQFALALLMKPPAHPRAIARWEAGESLPRASRLMALAAALRVPVDDLFEHVGPPAGNGASGKNHLEAD